MKAAEEEASRQSDARQLSMIHAFAASRSLESNEKTMPNV